MDIYINIRRDNLPWLHCVMNYSQMYVIMQERVLNKLTADQLNIERIPQIQI